MSNPLLIVHGWSASSQSFVEIQNFLIEQGLYEEIKLIDYKSLDDQVSLEDFADKFDEQFQHLFPSGQRLDVLCHSAGALVIRAWLALRRSRQKRKKQALDMPIERLFMFAPANFGSDLALLGQSGLHRLRTLLPILRTETLSPGTLIDPGEVGIKILQALEPASPTQWKLSHIDLHEEDYFGGNPDPALTCYPFIFAAGTFKQDNPLSSLIPNAVKPGTDNTVRICGTSLNTRKLVIYLEFSSTTQQLKTSFQWAQEKKFDAIAFAVFPAYNHGSVVQKGLSVQGDEDLLALFFQAKAVTNHTDYQENVVKNFQSVDQKNQSANQQVFQQFFFVLKDDIGNLLSDYFIDFEVIGADNKIQELLTNQCRDYFNRNELWSAHSTDSAFRILMLDYKKMNNFFEEIKAQNCKIQMVITVPQVSNEINFAEGKCVIFPFPEEGQSHQKASFLFPNVTTLVEIILDRKQKDTLLRIT